MTHFYGNCDTVRSEYSLLYYNSDDAICFGFFPTSIHGDYKFRKKPYATHYHLFNLAQIIGEDLYNKLDNKRLGEIKSTLCYNKTYGLGRCWDDHRVLAFWKPPTLKTLKKVVRSLRIDPNEFVMIVGTTHRGEQNITVAQYMANIPSEVENEIEIINKPLSSLGLGDIEDMVLNKGKTNITWAVQKEREGWKTMAQRNNTLYQESKKNMKQLIRLTENDLHQLVENSVRKIIKETRFGRPEPFFGREINGRSGMLYCKDTGEQCVLYDLHFMGNSIVGRDRDTNEMKTAYLVSLFARPIDGSTIPSAHRQEDNVVEITHLRVEGSENMWNLTVDDYFGGPEETAERDFASGY